MRHGEAGVALVNVLVLLAVTAGIVALMLGQQERGRDTVARAMALAQAEQIALGAEASVIAALRADLDSAPDADHFGEGWARVIQQEAELPDGRFSVAVSDVQAKFDINALATGGLSTQVIFLRLAARLDVPEAESRRIAETLALTGPLPALNGLAALGIARDTLDRLAPHVTALPVEGAVNLNTADPLLMEVLFQNPGVVAQLLRRRATQGFIDRDTLTDYGALRPALTGFTSHVWEVEVLAESGGARMRLTSRVLRRDDLSGKGIAVTDRRISYPLPPDA